MNITEEERTEIKKVLTMVTEEKKLGPWSKRACIAIRALRDCLPEGEEPSNELLAGFAVMIAHTVGAVLSYRLMEVGQAVDGVYTSYILAAADLIKIANYSAEDSAEDMSELEKRILEHIEKLAGKHQETPEVPPKTGMYL